MAGTDTSKLNTPWLALSLAAAVCVLYLASELYVLGGLALPLDDSWIHLQFARHLAAGDGLSYDGERWMPGSTAPLWTGLLAVGFVLPGGAVVWAKLLGIGCFLATVWATDRLSDELGLGRGLRLLAAALVATTHWLVWSALSGMEILLFSALSLWGITLHLRERSAPLRGDGAEPSRLPVSLPVLAAAALARPEGSLLLLLAVADRAVRFTSEPSGLRIRLDPVTPEGGKREAGPEGGKREAGPEGGKRETARSAWGTGILAAAAVALPTGIFYRLAGGSFLPTTFAVKTTPMADLIPSGRYLGAVLDVLFTSQPVMLLFAGAGALCLIERLGSRRDRGLLPALWPVSLALAYSILASPGGPTIVGNFGRYYFPVLPLVAVLGALGLEEAGRRLGASVILGVAPGGRRLPLRALLIAAVIAPQLWGVVKGPPRYLQTLANVEDSDVAAARWLAGRLPPEALLAVQDIGAIKYHLPNPIVDLTGIVNPDILPYLRGPGGVYWEERLFEYLAQKKPDYLIVFPRSYPWLTSSAPGFDKVQGFQVRHNVTMAGDELAILSTPWTRYRLAELAAP